MAAYRSGFAAVVGPANAGKSTLVNRIVGEKISIVSPKAQTTRNRILGIKTCPDWQLVLIDTPGYFMSGPGGKKQVHGALEQVLRGVSNESMTDADQVLMVIDGERAVRQHDYIDAAFGGLAGSAPTVIAINKIDLVKKAGLLPLFERLSMLFPERSVELVPVSARSGDGISELERMLVERLPESPPLFPEDQVTDASERFIAAEVVREKLFSVLEQELPYSVAVAVEKWEAQKEILKISAAITVERESQKGIVIGKGGRMLKTVGERARLELEKILQSPIYLQLFVRVDPNWTENEAGLRRAGVVNE